MAFTDYPVSAYVYPQDGSSSGISDFDADWDNAAYAGALALANTDNYSPQGLSVTPDYGANSFDVSDGLAFIRDDENIGFREFGDSEQTRSGTWTQGYLAVSEIEATSGISFETATGVNHVYLYFTRQAQNDVYIRVADTTADKPANRFFKIAEIDAGATESAEKNRNAGLDWQYIGSHETGGLVNEADIPIVDNSYDEYRVKFVGVGGDYTSTDAQLLGTVNNGGKYNFRTTQNNTRQKSFFKIQQSRPTDAAIGGYLFCSTHEGVWEYENSITGNIGKQYSFGGRDISGDATPFNSIQFSWNSGNIEGKWNIWGRNVL